MKSNYLFWYLQDTGRVNEVKLTSLLRVMKK